MTASKIVAPVSNDIEEQYKNKCLAKQSVPYAQISQNNITVVQNQRCQELLVLEKVWYYLQLFCFIENSKNLLMRQT